MSNPSFKDVIKSVLPRGPVWVSKPLSGLEQLYDAISDTKQVVKDWIQSTAFLRDPARTPFLSDLEREYGVRPVSTLSETDRREILEGIVYAKPGMGSDDMQARLHAAGFTDLFVYQNEPLQDPDIYIEGEWSCTCGNDDSVCGNDLAYCGLTGPGGYLLVNGPTYIPPGTGVLAEYEVPATDERWHLIFFVGGEKTDPTVGFFFITDGDMEAAGTTDWTAGNGAVLSKVSVDPYEGLQNLKVAGVDSFSKQDVGVQVPDPNVINAHRISDIGDNTFYPVDSSNNTELTNGVSGLTNPVLNAGANDTTAESVEFDGVDEGARGPLSQILDDQGAISFWAKINDKGRRASFRMRPRASGYGQLPQDITINSITESPVSRVVADDFTPPTWVAEVGDDLIRDGSTDLNFDDLSPGLGEKRVELDGAEYYSAADVNFADFGTDDFVLEVLFKFQSGTATVMSKYGAVGNRWEIVCSNTLARLILGGASASSIIISPPALLDGHWYLLHYFVDRSGFAIAYANGVAGSAVNVSALATDSLGDGRALTVGARSNGAIPFGGSVAYVGIWQGAGWLDTHTQQALVDERCARCFGIYPEVAQTPVPTTMTRASEAVLHKFIPDEYGGERGLAMIPVGDNWMRTEERRYVGDESEQEDTGFMTETSTTNSALYSEDFTNAVWVKSGATVSAAAETRLGEQSFTAIIADTSTGKHYVEQATTLAADDVVVSFWWMPGNRNGVRIEYVEDPTQWVMFDDAGYLPSGTSDSGSGMRSGSPRAGERVWYGDDLWRIEARFSCLANPTFRIMPATDGDDGDESYTGDGTSEEMYIFGAQFEKAKLGAATYLSTTSATRSSVDDLLQFSGVNNLSDIGDANYVTQRVWMNEIGPQANVTFFSIDDGGTADRIQANLLASTVDPTLTCVTGGSTQANFNASNSPLADNFFHDLAFEFYKDRFRIFKSGNEDPTNDNAGTPPVNSLLTVINVGKNQNLTLGANALVGQLEITSSYKDRPRGILGANDDVGPGLFIGYDVTPNNELGGLDEEKIEFIISTDATGAVLQDATARDDLGEVEGAWLHYALTWDGARTRLYVSGRERINAADTTVISTLNLDTLLLAWLPGLGYDATDAATEFATPRGDVSIADVRVYDQVPDPDWWDELTARGVNPYDRALVHRINPKLFLAVSPNRFTVLDAVSGVKFEDTALQLPQVGGTEVGGPLQPTATNPVNYVSDVASTFLQSQDHSFNGWIRVDNSSDNQAIWCNGVENSTTWQALTYDATAGALKYSCVCGSTLRTVEAPVVSGRMYHVAAVRSTPGGDTTLSIYLDGNQIETATYAGLPVVSVDTLYLFDTGGSPELQFTGALVDARFYNDDQTEVEIQAITSAGEAIIENGPYATQSISPPTSEAPFSGAFKNVSTDEAALVMVKEQSTGLWRALVPNFDGSDVTWQPFDKLTLLDEFRLYAKGYGGEYAPEAEFDDLDGGSESPDAVVQPVDVPEERRKALEDLVLRHKPLHSWAAMVVRYI